MVWPGLVGLELEVGAKGREADDSPHQIMTILGQSLTEVMVWLWLLGLVAAGVIGQNFIVMKLLIVIKVLLSGHCLYILPHTLIFFYFY